MALSRRDFLKATSAVGMALGLRTLLTPEDASGGEGDPSVIWLQAQGCSGCSVSLLNSITYGTPAGLLQNTLDLNYHPTLMAAAGKPAIQEAYAARRKKRYILVVEGAVPTRDKGRYCNLWPGKTAYSGVKDFARYAKFVLAVGTCSAYGGVVRGKPNPTGARPLQNVVRGKRVVNIPGCPSHPDWVVGSIAHILRYGRPPSLDKFGRPKQFYGARVHDRCPNLDQYNAIMGRYERHSKGKSCFQCHKPNDDDLPNFGSPTAGGCLFALGCRGVDTSADCPQRLWNAGEPGGGVNWCVAAGSPCHGCTEPAFPDGMSPFYRDAGGGSGRDDDDDHDDDDHPEDDHKDDKDERDDHEDDHHDREDDDDDDD
ncbi:hydrogenase small subunit [bacterium]|nr:hydrogenase small subunit [bacterium]